MSRSRNIKRQEFRKSFTHGDSEEQRRERNRAKRARRKERGK